MHFLSHYYTELPNDNPLFITALTIPDLTPRFSKIYNSVIRKAAVPEDENLLHIHQGLLTHYEADKNFHNSDAFVQHSRLALQSFIREGLSRERLRLSVIAHLAVEMLIDRQIILEDEALCKQFYSAVVQADEQVLETYFHHFALNDDKRRFFANFQFFKHRQFLYLFKEPEKIVFGLNRMYSSVTGVEFTADEQQRFLAAIHNIDTRMRYSWQEILKDKI
jgi:hypothetical protein